MLASGARSSWGNAGDEIGLFAVEIQLPAEGALGLPDTDARDACSREDQAAENPLALSMGREQCRGIRQHRLHREPGSERADAGGRVRANSPVTDDRTVAEDAGTAQAAPGRSRVRPSRLKQSETPVGSPGTRRRAVASAPQSISVARRNSAPQRAWHRAHRGEPCGSQGKFPVGTPVRRARGFWPGPAIPVPRRRSRNGLGSGARR